MDRLLSLSQAARMVGGAVCCSSTFRGPYRRLRGHIRVSELRKAYPEADSERSGMVEKVNRIREAAVFKATRDCRPDVDHLATELQRARVEVARLQDELTATVPWRQRPKSVC